MVYPECRYHLVFLSCSGYERLVQSLHTEYVNLSVLIWFFLFSLNENVSSEVESLGHNPHWYSPKISSEHLGTISSVYCL